jgi:integrase
MDVDRGAYVRVAEALLDDVQVRRHGQAGLHEARPTYASTLCAANVPIANVSRYMGHSSIAVTERVYFHLLPSAHEADLASINAFLATS